MSIIGLFTYNNSDKLNFLNIYLILLSIILEILHIFIPVRSFEFSDLFGNLLGVIIVLIINFFYKNMKILKINSLLYYYFLFRLVLRYHQILQIVVLYLMKDIYGLNMQKNLKKNGVLLVYLQLAIIKMESDFDWLAKPPRQKLFKVIPYKRPSSSFGYSQAVNGTWEQYKKETGNKLAVRTRFKDSVDFIGWYTNKSSTILKISKTDAFKQYVAYHEGWGDYKNYKNNKKIINLAKRVEKQSNVYKKQLIECKVHLIRINILFFR